MVTRILQTRTPNRQLLKPRPYNRNMPYVITYASRSDRHVGATCEYVHDVNISHETKQVTISDFPVALREVLSSYNNQEEFLSAQTNMLSAGRITPLTLLHDARSSLLHRRLTKVQKQKIVDKIVSLLEEHAVNKYQAAANMFYILGGYQKAKDGNFDPVDQIGSIQSARDILTFTLRVVRRVELVDCEVDAILQDAGVDEKVLMDVRRYLFVQSVFRVRRDAREFTGALCDHLFASGYFSLEQFETEIADSSQVSRHHDIIANWVRVMNSPGKMTEEELEEFILEILKKYGRKLKRRINK
jgi:hypothetical protein